ncbi:hypothetical protein PFISCL1PPCAC_18288 [Pristionchus fissidentatus]|uniref:Uncharacterized protein n=1 Tax=Pristionchus fissidentatus TaxID=1538716 RepID=A0AAV5W861_9BILA|nr:hypothetical protein PFISCL1PPCAC_18288 [Pristionchus fissidentatus]
MRLLVPPRMRLALRRNTFPLVSRGAATSAPTPRRKKTVAATPSSSVVLQRLRDLSRESANGLDPLKEREIRCILEGGEGSVKAMDSERLMYIVDDLSARNDFETLSQLLQQHSKLLEREKDTVVGVRLVTSVLSAASHAKSLSSLPPSILKWIENAVQSLAEPPEKQRELMVWLLAIVRGDLPMLQQLQKEGGGAKNEGGGVGPVIEKEKTLRQAALTYLEEGGNEQFRSLWSSSGSSLIGEEENEQTSALVHHGLLRRFQRGKPDPSMLRWYATNLASDQRTPIPSQPQFDTMMVPVVSALGGRIDKWTKGQLAKKESKLRRWRSAYSDVVMEDLKRAMIEYLKHSIVVEKRGSMEDLRRLEKLLDRLHSDDERGGGRGKDEEKRRKKWVVVDWLNLCSFEKSFDSKTFLPSHSLVIVGRDSNQGEGINQPPKETERIKTMSVTRKKEKIQEVDDVCSIIVAVATRGHLLSNDKTRPHVTGFEKYLRESSSFDVRLSRVLRDYLNDAVVTHSGQGSGSRGGGALQPVVDHSRGAQWIDNKKKELMFTVARKNRVSTAPFRYIDYYSLHID